MKAVELLKIRDNFMSELQDANNGEKTSLPFIVHELPEISLVKEGEEFQVIVIGGTYALNAHVRKENNTCVIISNEKSSLPVFLTKDDLLRFLEKMVDQDIRILALNFAFAILPIFEKGRLDGKLINGSKEHTFLGLIGEKIGEEVERYIFEKRKQKILVSIANDTVCLLLSGLVKASWENLGAGIVGSGMNFAFYLDKNRLTNLESANFNKFPQSEEGKELDRQSPNSGMAWYEKEVAGVYLYKHFNMLLRKRNINYPSIKSTEELDALARKDSNEASNLAQELLERSASLISCQIAAIMEFRKTDMVFVMEGSMFWKGYRYQETVENSLEKLTSYRATFTEIKDSGIVGAAHLVI